MPVETDLVLPLAKIPAVHCHEQLLHVIPLARANSPPAYQNLPGAKTKQRSASLVGVRSAVGCKGDPA